MTEEIGLRLEQQLWLEFKKSKQKPAVVLKKNPISCVAFSPILLWCSLLLVLILIREMPGSSKEILLVQHECETLD